MSYLSIITVAWNNLEGIKRTKDSIFPLPSNCEWVIVDANSSDGTKEFLEELPKSDSIKFISEKDSGIFDGMNKGISMSSGDYVVFLNSGDMFEYNVFLNVVKKQENNSDIIVYNYIPLDPNLKKAHARTISKDLSILKERNCLPHQSTLIKRELYNELGNHNLNYKVASDYDFFLKAYLHNKLFTFKTDVYLAYFVQDGTSFNTKNALKQASESKDIQESNYGSYSKKQYFMYFLKYLLSFLPFANKLNLLLRKLFLNKVK